MSSLQTLSAMMVPVMEIVIIAWIWLICLYKTATSRHKRYILATWGIIITMIVVGGLMFEAVLELILREYHNAGTHTGLAIVYLLLSNSFFDTDNWFKSQFKKLKRGFKNLRSRIAFPSPLPSPA